MNKFAKRRREKNISCMMAPLPDRRITYRYGLNKILKDFIVRFHTMKGYDAPYVPGWDCHGLPIEHRVMQEIGEEVKP